MKITRLLLAVSLGLLLLLAGGYLYYEQIANPRITRELIDDPNGERAQKVMLVTLPSGRRIPVNYLREGNRVYAGADGSWWKELTAPDTSVSLLIRGETLSGTARAVLDDPAHTRDVFSRLRPKALPGFGTLVEIQLARAAAPPTE